jgi:elongation factor 1-gamma
MALTLYTYMPNYRAWKSLVVAAYNDIKINVPEFKLHQDNATPEFLAKNPLGKVPVLDTPHGSLFESNAIARYVARLRPDTDLFGRSFMEQAQVEQWVDFSAFELEPVRAVWLFPILGFLEYDEESHNAARADMAKVMTVLNEHLKLRTYMVGNKVTLADIVLVVSLVDLYKMVFDPAWRGNYPHVNRWFETCVNLPQFARVVGKVDLCQNEQKAKAGAPAAAAAAGAGAGGNKGGKSKDEKKKEDKPKEENKPKPKKDEAKPKKEDKPKEAAPAPAAAAEGDEEDESAKEKKKPHPLEQLPPTEMKLDLVKKRYFELRPDFSRFFPEFWPKFDANGYSLWLADYKYPEENKIFFMTCNATGGFLQRLEDINKYGFGAVTVLGKDEDTGPFPIKCVFIFRGPDVPADVKEGGDYDVYNWTKLDASKEADRKRVEERFFKDTVDGLAVQERRYFK